MAHRSRNKDTRKIFRIELPAEVLTASGWSASEVPLRVREALVMELLRLDRLSEAKAAKLLGRDRADLVELTARHRVYATRMNADEFARETARRSSERRRILRTLIRQAFGERSARRA